MSAPGSPHRGASHQTRAGDVPVVHEWTAKEKKLIQVICIATFFMCVEIVGGYLANSVAIYSDALHMFADSAGFMISLAAAGYARMKPSTEYTYGYYRAEILGALGSLLLIWVLTIFLVIEAFSRIENIVTGGTVVVDGRIMTIIAAAGIFSNIIMLTVFSEEHHDSFSLAHSHEHGHCSGHGHADVSHEEVYEEEHHEESGGCSGHDHGHAHVQQEEPDLDLDHGHGHGHGHDEPDEETPLALADNSNNNNNNNNNNREGGSGDQESLGGNSGVMSRMTTHDSNRDLNMHAAYMHVLSDIINGVGVLIAGIFIWIDPNWVILDPICTIFFGFLVMKTTYSISNSVVSVLLEGVPTDLPIKQLVRELGKIKDVCRIFHVHAWTIGTGKISFTCQAVLEDNADAEAFYAASKIVLSNHNIQHSTIQIRKKSAVIDNSEHQDCATIESIDSVH